MELLQLREEEIFKGLRELSPFRLVVIGGYATNSYTLARFSVDCDIVVHESAEADKIGSISEGLGYKKTAMEGSKKSGGFRRYEKELENGFIASFDVMVGEVVDRHTGAHIGADWVFDNSEMRELKGKTITDSLRIRIINMDALFVMKMVSCRATDIRDLFMLAPYVKNQDKVRSEVSNWCDFGSRFRRVREKVTSKGFKDGIRGVYGLMDPMQFEANLKALMSLDGT